MCVCVCVCERERERDRETERIKEIRKRKLFRQSNWVIYKDGGYVSAALIMTAMTYDTV